MDALPVAPDHDLSSYAGLPSSLSQSVSDGDRWSGCNDKVPVLPHHDTSSLCGSVAPDASHHSMHSSMGFISDLTLGTFCTSKTEESRMKSGKTTKAKELGVTMSEAKKDVTPKRVRRHSCISTNPSSPDPISGPKLDSDSKPSRPARRSSTGSSLS